MKLGGSLARSPCLADWLGVLAAAQERHLARLVVVPGGGPFADQVRALQETLRFSDALAHELAIRAMEQFARLLVALGSGLALAASRNGLRRAWADGLVPVWLPWRMLRGRPEVPESWEVTSDSLAAWLASQLSARSLVLVKSARPEAATAPLSALVASGLVDPALPGFLPAGGVAAWCLAADESAALPSLLGATAAAGTRILVDGPAGASC